MDRKASFVSDNASSHPNEGKKREEIGVIFPTIKFGPSPCQPHEQGAVQTLFLNKKIWTGKQVLSVIILLLILMKGKKEKK